MLKTTYSQLADFAPTLRGLPESEPTLHRIITYYYLQVFDKAEAEELATEFIQSLKGEINGSGSSLG
jgi:hypothetical protein